MRVLEFAGLRTECDMSRKASFALLAGKTEKEIRGQDCPSFHALNAWGIKGARKRTFEKLGESHRFWGAGRENKVAS